MSAFRPACRVIAGGAVLLVSSFLFGSPARAAGPNASVAQSSRLDPGALVGTPASVLVAGPAEAARPTTPSPDPGPDPAGPPAPGVTLPEPVPGTGADVASAIGPGSPDYPTGQVGSIRFPASVERWRSLVARYIPPELVEKALWTMTFESDGDASAIGDGGYSIGLFQVQDGALRPGRPDAAWLLDPENNIRYAAQVLGMAQGNFADWGEGTTGLAPFDPFTGVGEFGSLGRHPFPAEGSVAAAVAGVAPAQALGGATAAGTAVQADGGLQQPATAHLEPQPAPEATAVQPPPVRTPAAPDTPDATATRAPAPAAPTGSPTPTADPTARPSATPAQPTPRPTPAPAIALPPLGGR